MDSFLVAFNAVMPMILLAVFGYFIKVYGYLNENSIGQLNKVCFDIFLPVLTFNNIAKADIKSIFDIKLIIYASAIIFSIILVCIILVPLVTKNRSNQGSMIQAIYRSNYVILGLPIARYLGGQTAQEITSMLIMVVIPIYNFTAVVILSIYGGTSYDKKQILLGIIKNHMIFASIIGIIVSLLNISFPSFIQVTINNFSSLGSIMPMLVLGASINLSRVTANKRPLIIGVVSKLIVVPLIFVPLSIALGYSDEKLIALLIMLIAPPAVSSAVMAKEMGCNFELSTQLVVFSTIISSVTVFFWIFALDSLNFI